VTVLSATWIALTLISWNKFAELDQDSGAKSNLLDQLWKYQYLLQHFLASLIIVYNFTKRRSLEKLMRLIYNFDKLMKSLDLGFKTAYWKYTIVVLHALTLAIILTYQLIAIYVHGSSDLQNELISIVMIVANVVINHIYLMISMQFIMNAHYINVRLGALIKYMRC
jgi:hypothetical protein